MIVIMLTELFCYPFLCEHFKNDDLKFKRLELREGDYLKILPELVRLVCPSSNALGQSAVFGTEALARLG
jgi:hypothetical protein